MREKSFTKHGKHLHGLLTVDKQLQPHTQVQTFKVLTVHSATLYKRWRWAIEVDWQTTISSVFYYRTVTHNAGDGGWIIG